MSGPFRFLHASDFHLDRPPRGLTEVPEQLADGAGRCSVSRGGTRVRRGA